MVFPHGTPDGFKQGCRGRLCPGAERGQTCAEAMVRYRGDYAYRNLVNSGAPVEQLQQPEEFARPVTSKPVKTRSRLIVELNADVDPEPEPEPEPEADDEDLMRGNPMRIMHLAVS